MRIEFVQKNYDMSDRLREILDKKIEKLAKYFDDDAKAKVTLKKQGEDCKTELAIFFNGMFIRAEVSSDNMYDNIDDLLPKIEKQVFKYKTKLSKKLRSSAFKDAPMFAMEEQKESKVVRYKKFDLKPMHIEDAIMELDLVDHDFYIYIDEKTKEVNIVYRRSDGDIGVLQPN